MVFRRLANLLMQSASKATPTLKLAVFGKHPGWLDHMEEIGLTNDRLIALRRMLYSEGINQNIDSGAWSKLEDGQTIERFKHVYIWKNGNDLIIGRLWSSTDGRGRSLYPMVLGVQCNGIPLRLGLRLILPRLEQLEKQLVATDTADAVRLIIRTAQTELLAVTKSTESFEDGGSEQAALTRLADHPDLGPDRQGLYRMLYQIEQEMGDPASLRTDSRSGVIELPRTHLLRVPCCGDQISETASLWYEFLTEHFGETMPFLLVLPLEHDWVDMIFGQPSASHLFCLKASLERMPLTTTVPYNIPEEFQTQVDQRIEKAQPPAGA